MSQKEKSSVRYSSRASGRQGKLKEFTGSKDPMLTDFTKKTKKTKKAKKSIIDQPTLLVNYEPELREALEAKFGYIEQLDAFLIVNPEILEDYELGEYELEKGYLVDKKGKLSLEKTLPESRRFKTINLGLHKTIQVWK